MRTVSVRLLAEISGYISPIRAATQATRDFRTELAKAAAAGKLDAVASLATRAGIALVAGFAAATTAAARFEKQMSEVSAVTNASADDLKALSEAAIQAGKDTIFSATEAAKAEAELAKAGLSTSEILGGALSGSLSLAAAGSLDLSEAADTAAKAMNIFGLQGEDVAHIADVLAAGANKSATDVHELGMALRMGGLAAKNSGLTLEETVGTLAAFADNALIGSDAGTSFKMMLQMLAAPSTEATARMNELGISAYDAQGNFIGIAKLAGVLQEQLKDLTQEQRNEALATIFGSDAMRAASVLYNSGERGIRLYTAAVDDQGAAADMAARKTDNLMGDIERLTGALESLFIESGSGANSGLRTLVQGLTGVVDIISKIPTPVLAAATVIAGLAGTGLLAVSAFIRARDAFSEAMSALREAGPVSGRVATGLEHTTRWAARAAIAMGTLKLAAVALDALTNEQTDIEGLNYSLQRLGEANLRSGELTRLFGDDLNEFGRDAEIASGRANAVAAAIEGWIPGVRQLNELFTDTSFGGAAERIKEVDAALATLVRDGNVDAARAAYVRLLQASKMSTDELAAVLPQYLNAITQAEEETGKQAAAAKIATERNVALAGAFGEAASEADGLKDAFDALNGKTLGWREAERNAEAAVDDLVEALKESHGSLDAHTEKGREAAAAVDELAEAAAVAAQKKMDETGSVEDASAVYKAYIDQLRGTLQQAGLTKTQVEELVNSIARMPAFKSTTISVDVITRATLIETARENARAATGRRWGGVTVHAATGLLREAATFTPQSPARYAFAEPATMGEAFIPKQGNYGRSMSILSEAAGWYGADVVPRNGAAGAGIDYAQLGAAVAEALRTAPIQGVAVMDGHAVGELVSAQQTAAVYARPRV